MMNAEIKILSRLRLQLVRRHDRWRAMSEDAASVKDFARAAKFQGEHRALAWAIDDLDCLKTELMEKRK